MSAITIPANPAAGTALVETLATRHFQAVVDLGSTDMLAELD